MRRIVAGPGFGRRGVDAESASSSLLVPCLVVAERVEVVEETVFRYPRERLGPGERLAPGVFPPQDPV